MQPIQEVRPSPIAGFWYSKDPGKLTQEIDSFLRNSILETVNGRVMGILAPHAGYRYSGKTAGLAFQTIVGKQFDLVVVISPFHQYVDTDVLTTAHRYYATPLGEIPVDQELVQKFLKVLKTDTQYKSLVIANDEEHALEIELPFLQRALTGSFSLLPLMVRSIDPQTARDLAKILNRLIDSASVLIVASTDLSHFYPQTEAERLDGNMLTQIETFSSDAVYETERKGKGYACGLGAILLAMEMVKIMGADQVKILGHSTSAAETGDTNSVVGYGAGVFLQKKPAETG
ncbi:MAG: AmmeMemoRadiSam system protein B [Chloroflexi bacterium HGW-Chloroflexi-10]|nr:MAG: AmmeMemoRadiSam system protein B [Chloroflexi bacterium HGW-Chloroflexi-10]